MCRNIKNLFNFDPPVTADEIRAASLQFVRKISGFNKPSQANERFFLDAVDRQDLDSASAVAGNERTAEESSRGSGEGESSRCTAIRHLKGPTRTTLPS
jgi:hypothetical protein